MTECSMSSSPSQASVHQTALLRFFSVCLALLALVAFAGCDRETCTGACSQYYGESEGDCGRQSVLSDGTNSAQALDQCVNDCREALYTTTGTRGCSNSNFLTEQSCTSAGHFWSAELSGTDTGGYARLENEADALEFIRCIVDKDYSEAAFNQTCADLFYDCRWIKW